MANLNDSQPRPGRGKQLALRLLIAAIILAIGAVIAVYLTKTAPKANKRAPKKTSALVQVITVQPSQQQVRVAASGQVMAARQMTLQAQVAGQVVSIHPDFIEGSLIPAGGEVLLIDPADYQLMVADKQARLAEVQAALDLELGQQQVAQREWELFQSQDEPMENSPSLALVLREPYLKKAQAAVKAAEVAVAKAQLDLKRTMVPIPFDALVISKSVDLGSQLSAQSTIAELVAVDTFWLQLSLPMEKLAWIDIPAVSSEHGAMVELQSADGQLRQGTVIRLLADLEQQGRMARLLVAVDDPLDLEQPLGKRHPLLLGEYVQTQIVGKPLNEVVVLPRSVVHNGNQVWLAVDGHLQIREVEIVWRDAGHLFISAGLQAGEQVIVSQLATPVAGLPLRIDVPKALDQRDHAMTESH
ncbi:MAG: efflux RND transporter periplasmic adaptor subunit [Desulfuromonas sp.]|nr:efflux RND transporter periplasmic adaptor subunit [Desulfuromonas sp.]